MNYRTRVLIAVAAITYGLAFSASGESTALAQDGGPVSVSLIPFETQGSATVEVARSMSSRLTELLDADPRLDVVPSGKSESPQPRVRYLIKGIVYAEDARRFLSLTVVDAKSGETLWHENYDYTNITADMIAPDVVKALVK
jgi:TolB-like protein